MTTIVTKRLLLLPPPCTLGDVKKQVSWLNDKTLMQYSEQRHRHHTVISQWEYIDSFRLPSEFRVVAAGGEMVGTITAHVDKHNKVADMGILIGEKQGQGYGTEAWIAMMEHLFGNGVRKVEAGCMEYNTGMMSIFEKSGMHREGCKSHHFITEFSFGEDEPDTCALEQWAKYTGEP